ncbi:MAG TPA: epoxyqueuosine reductase QueH [Clostridia bacterium]|nr:epoxyqueuosine reductase QueH [Clostridia bacterium]
MTPIVGPKRLLLHACCGPCAMWPLERLLEEGIDVTLFFFNPNIHPRIEWQRRLENAAKVADHYDVPMIVRGCSMSEAWRERANDGDERCRYCYRTRLSSLADEAEAGRFDAISTTLFVSPYQKRDLIIKEGEKVAVGRPFTFTAYDWRDGFRRGQQMAKELGLYRQKYCGCIISFEQSKFFESVSREHEQIALCACLNSKDFLQEAEAYDTCELGKLSCCGAAED